MIPFELCPVCGGEVIEKEVEKLILGGNWVERYEDASGKHRIDHVVTGGGGAPLYSYQGEPATKDFLAAGKENKVALEHLVKPGMTAGENPYHYVVLRVDGDDVQLEVVGVDWGRGFSPYRGGTLKLTKGGTS